MDLPYRGRTVLLLGGQVEESPQDDEFFDVIAPDEADVRVEEAIIALARAVFARGGQLAFRDDPLVTPLALELVLEYWQSLPGEETGREDRRFTAAPLLILDGERSVYHDDVERAIHIGYATNGAFGSQLESPPDRVVCIGGGLDLIERVNQFSRPNTRNIPVFSIPSAGGAASQLQRILGVRNPEEVVYQIVRSRTDAMRFAPPELEPNEPTRGEHRDWETSSFEPERIPQFRYSIYPLIMNAILDPDFEQLPVAAR
jgi:hypothetical protein